MKSWEIKELEVRPGRPEIVASTADARAIVLALPAGQSLDDHQVHERAWLTVIEGEIAVAASGGSLIGGPGLLVEFDPEERHRVEARADARLLLLLTPWPGAGHPGAMSIGEKAEVRERAAAKGET